MTPEALARLLEHAWPGNVRELEHVIERAVLLGREPAIGVQDLPPSVKEDASASGISFAGEIVPMREAQRRYAAWVYERLGGRKMQTADKLGGDFKTLSKWLIGDEDPDRRD